jgi:hypothetical protein
VIRTRHRRFTVACHSPLPALGKIEAINHQPNITAMKTTNSQLSAVMILPAALLFSQCAPVGRTPSPTVIAVPTSARHLMPGSSGPSMFFPLGTRVTGKWAAYRANEPPRIASQDRTYDDTSEPQTIMLEPLVVTDNMYSLLIAGMRYWPGDIVDAAEKKAWISFKPQDRSSRYPTGDSIDAWSISLR